MASSRRTQVLVVGATAVLVASAGALLARPRAEAACLDAMTKPPWGDYAGAIGTLAAPFAIPQEAMKVARVACDQGAAFDPKSTPRVLLVADPQISGVKPTIVIVENDDEGCNKARPSCEDQVKNAAAVYCVGDKSLKLTNQTLEFTVPDITALSKPGEHPESSGPLRVAVTNHAVPPCAKVIQSDACENLESEDVAHWHACIDRVFQKPCPVPTPKWPDGHGVFQSATILPKFNDFRVKCFEDKNYCAPAPTPASRAEYLEYAVDSDGNMIIPVDWAALRAKCGGACGVSGAVAMRNGRFFVIPDNTVTNGVLTNDFLESFTTLGAPIQPLFRKESLGSGAAAVSGRTDQDKSVLRLRRVIGRCLDDHSGAVGVSCGPAGTCNPGTTCQLMCVGGAAAGANCSNEGTPCGSGGNKGRCGVAHDRKSAHGAGGWKLDRKHPGLCQVASGSLCNSPKCSTNEPCVEYWTRVFDPPPTPKPVGPTPTPGEDERRAFLELVQTSLGAKASEFSDGGVADPDRLSLIQSSAGTWVAGYIARPAGGETTTSPSHGSVRGGQTIILARRGANGFAEPELVELDSPMINHGIRFSGEQLRILTQEAPRGATASSSGTSRTGVLWVLNPNANGGSPRLVRVGRAVVADRQYDPLTDGPEGGTLYLAPSGRCVAGERTLAVPSYCRPDHLDCPGDAKCRPEDLVVAIDLHTDIDRDGVPDALPKP